MTHITAPQMSYNRSSDKPSGHRVGLTLIPGIHLQKNGKSRSARGGHGCSPGWPEHPEGDARDAIRCIRLKIKPQTNLAGGSHRQYGFAICLRTHWHRHNNSAHYVEHDLRPVVRYKSANKLDITHQCYIKFVSSEIQLGHEPLQFCISDVACLKSQEEDDLIITSTTHLYQGKPRGKLR